MKQNTTIKTFLGLLLMTIFTVASLQAQNGRLSGRVLDKDDHAAPLAKVKLMQGANLVNGTMTDENGRYQFGVLEPGKYIIEAFDGEKTVHYNVTINYGESQQTLIEMAIAYEGDAQDDPLWSVASDGVVIMPDNELFTVDPVVSKTITGDEIRKISTTRGSLEDIAAVIGRATQADHGDPVNMSGARPGGTAMYIDNMKVRGTGIVPQAAIKQMTVINGGIPAEFGDLTGGLIIITTHNPGMRGFVGKPRNYEKRMMRKQLRKKGKEQSLHQFQNLMASN